MENESRKRPRKLYGITVGRIRTFPFLPIPFTTPSLMIQWKLGCWSWSTSGRTNQLQGPESNIVNGLFFCFCLRLRQYSFRLIISDGVISRISVLLPTPSVWFSLDCIVLRCWVRLRQRTTQLLVKTSLQYNSGHCLKKLNDRLGVKCGVFCTLWALSVL